MLTVNDAIRAIEASNEESYLAACQLLSEQRDKLEQIVFIRIPVIQRGLSDPKWGKVKAQTVQYRANERIIVPRYRRTEFSPSPQEMVTLSEGKSIFLKPVYSNLPSTLIKLCIREKKLTMTIDPLTTDSFLICGELSMFARILRNQSRPPVVCHQLAGIKIPLFAVCVSCHEDGFLSFIPDIGMKIFDPLDWHLTYR